MKCRRLLRLGSLLLAAAVLVGCSPRGVATLGRQIHTVIYLPDAAALSLRFAGARRLGPHMGYLRYVNGDRSLTLFESSAPIARPPGALARDGMYLASTPGRAASSSVWLRQGGTYLLLFGLGMQPQRVIEAAKHLRIAR